MRSILAAALTLSSSLFAQVASPAPSPVDLAPAEPAPALSQPLVPLAGPFEAPEEMREFVRRTTLFHSGMKEKVQALLRATFLPVEDGGLGMVYDNSRTRTVREVWEERRANCLGLTAYFVSACRVMGFDANFAEAPGVSQWRKVGGFIRHEKHMVATLDNKPTGVMVMDFAPDLRKNFYNVIPLGEAKALAMFHSNRAVERLDAGNVDEAFEEAKAGIAASPLVGVAWNVLGVLHRVKDDPAASEVAFRKALEVDPSEAAACGNLETLYKTQGRLEEAETWRNLAIQLRARDPYFHAFLAREAMDRGDLKLARKEVNTALKIFKREPEFYLLMAQIELKDGDRQDAERALESAKKWASPEEQARMDSKLALIRNPQP